MKTTVKKPILSQTFKVEKSEATLSAGKSLLLTECEVVESEERDDLESAVEEEEEEKDDVEWNRFVRETLTTETELYQNLAQKIFENDLATPEFKRACHMHGRLHG